MYFLLAYGQYSSLAGFGLFISLCMTRRLGVSLGYPWLVWSGIYRLFRVVYSSRSRIPYADIEVVTLKLCVILWLQQEFSNLESVILVFSLFKNYLSSQFGLTSYKSEESKSDNEALKF